MSEKENLEDIARLRAHGVTEQQIQSLKEIHLSHPQLRLENILSAAATTVSNRSVLLDPEQRNSLTVQNLSFNLSWLTRTPKTTYIQPQRYVREALDISEEEVQAWIDARTLAADAYLYQSQYTALREIPIPEDCSEKARGANIQQFLNIRSEISLLYRQTMDVLSSFYEPQPSEVQEP